MSNYIDLIVAPSNGYINSSVVKNDMILNTQKTAQKMMFLIDSNDKPSIVLSSGAAQVYGKVRLINPATNCNLDLTVSNSIFDPSSLFTIPSGSSNNSGVVQTTNTFNITSSNIVPTAYAISNAYTTLATSTPPSQWSGSSNIWIGPTSNVTIGTTPTLTSSNYTCYVSGPVYATSYCNIPSSPWVGTSNLYFSSNVTIGMSSACNSATLYVNGSMYATAYCNLQMQWNNSNNTSIWYGSNVLIGGTSNTTSSNYMLYVNGPLYAVGYCNMPASYISQWSGNSNIWYGCNVAIGISNNATTNNYTLYVNGSVCATAYRNVPNSWFGTSNIMYGSNVMIGLNYPMSNYTMIVNGPMYASSYCNLPGSIVQWANQCNNTWYGSNVGIGLSNTNASLAYTLYVKGSMYANTYCNLTLPSFPSASQSNALTCAQFSNVYLSAANLSNAVFGGSRVCLEPAYVVPPVSMWGGGTSTSNTYSQTITGYGIYSGTYQISCSTSNSLYGYGHYPNNFYFLLQPYYGYYTNQWFADALTYNSNNGYHIGRSYTSNISGGASNALAGEWLQFTAPVAFSPAAAYFSWKGVAPFHFAIVGGTDGVNWDMLYNRYLYSQFCFYPNINPWASPDSDDMVFTLSNTGKKYSTFRYIVTRSSSNIGGIFDDKTSLGKWIMFARDECQVSDTWSGNTNSNLITMAGLSNMITTTINNSYFVRSNFTNSTSSITVNSTTPVFTYTMSANAGLNNWGGIPTNTTSWTIPVPGVWEFNCILRGGNSTSNTVVLQKNNTPFAYKGYYGQRDINIVGNEYFNGTTDAFSVGIRTINSTTNPASTISWSTEGTLIAYRAM